MNNVKAEVKAGSVPDNATLGVQNKRVTDTITGKEKKISLPSQLENRRWPFFRIDCHGSRKMNDPESPFPPLITPSPLERRASRGSFLATNCPQL